MNTNTILSAYVDSNGELVSNNGIIEYTNEILMEAQARIFTPLGSWWGNLSFGSTFPLLGSKGYPKITIANITSSILTALQPMIAAQRIKSANCQIAQNNIVGNYINFSVILVDNNNYNFILPIKKIF